MFGQLCGEMEPSIPYRSLVLLQLEARRGRGKNWDKGRWETLGHSLDKYVFTLDVEEQKTGRRVGSAVVKPKFEDEEREASDPSSDFVVLFSAEDSEMLAMEGGRATKVGGTVK